MALAQAWLGHTVPGPQLVRTVRDDPVHPSRAGGSSLYFSDSAAALGEQFFYRLVDRLSEPIVYAIKKPVTLAVLDEVVKVLETGNYPENLAKSLKEHQPELEAIIQEKLTLDPQLGKLRRVPFHGEIVHAVVDTSFRIVLEVLLDPRIDDFFSAVVRDNREQIRRAVELGLNEEDLSEQEKLLRVRTQRSAAREFDELHQRDRD